MQWVDTFSFNEANVLALCFRDYFFLAIDFSLEIQESQNGEQNLVLFG